VHFLYISEYAAVPLLLNAGTRLHIGVEPASKVQVVLIGDTSSTSEPLDARTRFVRLCASAPCHVAFGPEPEATAASAYLPADAPELFGAGGGNRVAVIARHEHATLGQKFDHMLQALQPEGEKEHGRRGSAIPDRQR
jgi:hypothetical protein